MCAVTGEQNCMARSTHDRKYIGYHLLNVFVVFVVLVRGIRNMASRNRFMIIGVVFFQLI